MYSTFNASPLAPKAEEYGRKKVTNHNLRNAYVYFEPHFILVGYLFGLTDYKGKEQEFGKRFGLLTVRQAGLSEVSLSYNITVSTSILLFVPHR